MKRILLVNGAELIAFILLACIPLAVSNSYALGLLTLLAIYGILLIGLDVSVGYLGQVNLGHAAFLGLGAYAGGLCVMIFGFSMLPALLASLLVGFVFGGLLAFPALRLEGPQFALATLSFSALTATTLNELESITQGAQGLQVDRPLLFGLHLGPQGFFWLCLVLLALTWIAMKNLLSSHWGRAFEALRDSPIATDAMGVGVFRHKVAAFALGSGLGGLAGGLYAFNFQFLQPNSFVYELMVILLLGVVLGGRKSLWGAFVGACLIVLLPNLLSNRTLFQVFSFIGLFLALVAGTISFRKQRRISFQVAAPIVSMALLVAGSLLVREHRRLAQGDLRADAVLGGGGLAGRTDGLCRKTTDATLQGSGAPIARCLGTRSGVAQKTRHADCCWNSSRSNVTSAVSRRWTACRCKCRQAMCMD